MKALRIAARGYRVELLLAAAYLTLLIISTQTDRMWQLAAASAALLCAYVVWTVITAIVRIARDLEREACAQCAEGTRMNATLLAADRLAAEDMRRRIAAEIRGQPSIYSLEPRPRRQGAA